MSEEEKVTPEYLKSHEEGYIMAKYAPDLAQQLASIKPTTPELVALHDGIKTYVFEKAKVFEQTKYETPDNFLQPDKDIDLEPEP